MGTSRLLSLGRGKVPTGTLVGIGIAAPFLTLLLSGVGPEGLERLVRMSGLVAYALVLGAGVLAYIHWRMVSDLRGGGMEDRLAQWLTVGLIAGAVNGLLQLGGGTPPNDTWLVTGQLVVLLLLCGCAFAAERVDVPGGPALAGTVVAIGLSAAYLLGQHLTPPGFLRAADRWPLEACVVGTGIALSLIVLRRTQVSLWARRRLAGGAILVNAAQCLAYIDHRVPRTAFVVAALLYLAGAGVLCAMAHHLLRASVLERRDEIQKLQDSLADVRAAIARERELLHEVGATLAGISTASQVMHRGNGLTAQRRRRLQEMQAAELRRLERLMSQRVSGADVPDQLMSVDDVVAPVVTSHQARGRNVSWRPSGQETYGDPDELAELCNILLENAARHAPGAPVRLTVAADERGVQVMCSDAGPGVDPAVRGRIFDPEVKGDGSRGQGLGLAIAHRIATSRGGSLELRDDGRPGATFLAHLPVKAVSRALAGHVA